GTPREVRMPVQAGLRTISATFLGESTKAEIAAPAGRRGNAAAALAFAGRGASAPPPAQLDLRLDGTRLKLFSVGAAQGFPLVDRVVVAGPYSATGPGETPSRARVFVCHPANSEEEAPCAQKIL